MIKVLIFSLSNHDVVNERRKHKEFVGGLDRDATEEDLRKVFSQVGEITEVRLLKNPVVSFLFHFSFLYIILEVLLNINFLNVSRKLILKLFFKTCTIC